MDYKTKIKYAEGVADQLQQMATLESIKSDLSTQGVQENNIAKIITSGKKILGERYLPKIQTHLLEGKQIQGAEEFGLIDEAILTPLINQERRNIAAKEKNKITKLIKEGQSPEEVFSQTDTRFLSAEKAKEHITHLQEVKRQNSGSGRMLNIIGGIGLIILTGVLFVTMDRIFYVLPFIGLGLVAKGFMTEKME